ncbi:ATP-binding cassette domain-containing protein [Actinopolymorpha pittospori]
MLAAFRKPSAGTALIDGQPVFENAAITSQVCLVRETGDAADRSEKVNEALRIARRLRPDWDEDYAARLLDRFGLPLDKRIGDLSRGQRSAFGIVVGLASRAPVTMFDESHLGMDAPSRTAFHDALLEDFMARPRTVVISTHLIEEMSPLFEEVLILAQGRLLIRENAEALRARGAVVTGAADTVDRFTAGLTVLSERSLGPTKSAVVYATLGEARRRQAEQVGLDVAPVPLQDLFTHLTEPTGALR